ncbi:ABC transporter ATP-binding protein [Candidatus Saccharibacteria bacterium]|nr:ABC transporter ATP-binding protein [Candidatus Saccharibacteria bacterium]
MNDQNNVIEIVDLEKSFVLPHTTVKAIKKCSLSIPKNSFTIIHGPSGSGKSTLLDAITGLEVPTAGSVIFNSVNLYKMSNDKRANFRANNLGLVYQTNYWVASLNVLDNVCVPLFLSGYLPHEARPLALEALKKINVDHLAKQGPDVLSIGEQQRVSMARALVSDPQVIIADEPTGSLDTTNGDAIMSLLLSLKTDFNKTIIMVTHNLEYLPMSTYRISVKDGIVTEDQQEHGLSSETKEKLKHHMSDEDGTKVQDILSSPSPTSTANSNPDSDSESKSKNTDEQ